MVNFAFVWGPGRCFDSDTGAASLYEVGIVVEENVKDEVVQEVHHYLLHVHFLPLGRVQYARDTPQVVLNHMLELNDTFLGEGNGKSLSFDTMDISILSVRYVECPGLLPRAQLDEYIDDWRGNVPDTFEPYYYEEQERDTFPVIRLLCPWHVVGLHFYHTAKILLASHFPQPSPPHTTPDTNINTNNTLTYHHHLLLKTTILPHVYALCAISFSNDHFGCRINASHCVAMGAQFLTGRGDQWRVIEYFRMLGTENAWPSRACLDMVGAV
ncbi:hypothetical protein RIB2604_02700950 [Aspergillus luchuensis]|uniref:Uncharacterized protein n=1 Tax=Aspergillus kawachii TaxID=1069201 RepID=A0A146FT04_ASPKA|nr:hypothetical protein RIB2604_02700950 [Aspergillus luchuensis]